MDIAINNIANLLKSTKVIIDHQQEVEILKGEKFNVFSILRMESKENATHSAFLGELLDPLGSHLKGNLFLDLFLKVINYKIKKTGKEANFDVHSAKLKLEHHVGTRNDKDETGGRIDIFLWDDNGISISIENKIYADDQNKQIARYVNHNKEMNTVYYLTLNGNEASEESKGDMVNEQDYHLISYRDTIVQWLEKCLKEAADSPILRETIRQYIILIKKLTNTMDDKSEKELTTLFLNNFEAARNISDNFNQIIKKIGFQIQQGVLEKLQDHFEDKKVKVFIGNRSRDYMQNWVTATSKKGNLMWYGVEGFSGYSSTDGPIFVGIHTDSKEKLTKQCSGTKHRGWPISEDILDFENEKVSFRNSNLLKKISANQDGFNENLIMHISSQSIAFMDRCMEEI